MSERERIQDHKAFSQGELCPSCGGPTIVGFGLAGGGYGPYTYCPKCQIVTSKSADDT